MWRALVVSIVLLVGARSAVAAPAPWTFDLPSGWSDITNDADMAPTIHAAGQPIVRHGGTFDAKAYRNTETGTGLFIVTTDMASMTTLESRDTMERAAGERGRKDATEREYKQERTPTVVNVTQRVTLRGVSTVTRRIEGFLRSGGLRVISINCYGEDVTCDPLIDAVHIDNSVYRPLGDVPTSDSSMAYRIGTIVGSLLGALLFVLIINAIRRRFA